MRGIDGPRDILRYLDSMKLDVIYTLHFLSIDRQGGVGGLFRPPEVYDDRFGFFWCPGPNYGLYATELDVVL